MIGSLTLPRLQLRTLRAILGTLAVFGLLISMFPLTAIQAHASLLPGKGIHPQSFCPQPPSNLDLTTLPDQQLALYGLPKRPRNAAGLSWWRQALHNAKHRICSATSRVIRIATSPTQRSVSPLYLGQVNTAIWAGAIDTGFGYQAVSGNWQEPCLTGYGRIKSDAYAWVGLGGAYKDPSVGTNDGPLVQAGTDSDVLADGTKEWDEFVEVHDDATGLDYQNTFFLAGQTSCNDLMSAYVSSNYDYAGKNYFFVQDVTRVSYYGCSPDSCPCESSICSSPNPANAPISNGSTAQWIVERSPNDDLAKFSTSNCTAQTFCMTFSNDYVDRNNSQHNIGVDPADSTVIYDTAGRELAYPGPIHNNNFFNDYWLAYS